MSNYAKSAAEVSDKYLASLADTQEAFLSSVSKLSALAPAIPAPVFPAPAFAADLPTPREITEVSFAFAAKLLKQQKAFADKLFATTKVTEEKTNVTEEKKAAPAKIASAKN